MAKAKPFLFGALAVFLVVAGIVWVFTGSLGIALLTGVGRLQISGRA